MSLINYKKIDYKPKYSSNVWVSSDFHGGHRNIVYGESTWSDKKKCRPFDTVEEHDEVLIYNINACVGKKDVLYFLGDGTMGGRDNIYDFWSKINCKNIHYIMGNHDQHIRRNIILKIEDKFINSRNLFSSCNELIEKKIGGNTFIMCHYPMRSWHKGSSGSIMLHGHCHGNLSDYIRYSHSVEDDDRWELFGASETDKFKTMDVGVDTHKEFRPYNLDEIKEIMNNRINLKVDHHE